jgi:hypothetical protein
MLNEGNQIHNFIFSSGSGTVINYGSGSGSDFLTSYGSGFTRQKVTVPTPVPVPQHCRQLLMRISLADAEGSVVSNGRIQLYSEMKNVGTCMIIPVCILVHFLDVSIGCKRTESLIRKP